MIKRKNEEQAIRDIDMEVEQAITRIITREPRRIPRERQGYDSGREPLVTVFPPGCSCSWEAAYFCDSRYPRSKVE